MYRISLFCTCIVFHLWEKFTCIRDRAAFIIAARCLARSDFNFNLTTLGLVIENARDEVPK